MERNICKVAVGMGGELSNEYSGLLKKTYGLVKSSQLNEYPWS